MKKLTLALLLALCGARVYGQLPQEAAVKPEDFQAMAAAVEATLKDTKSVDAICQELNLPKEEVKGWFSRHKALTGGVLGTYAAILALSLCGQEAVIDAKSGKVTMLNGSSIDADKQAAPTKMIKFRNAMTYLKYAQLPFFYMNEGRKAGYAKAKAHPYKAIGGTLVVAALAIFAAYELYQGKDSAVAALLNKLFGKKEAVAPAATEVAAEPAQPAAEKEEAAVVAPEAAPVAPAIEVVA
jgi:hypothetical protein